MSKIVTGPKPSGPAGTDPAPSATIVLFGAAGALVKRLLMPSLYNLSLDGLLDDDTKILGVDIAQMSADDWKDGLGETIQSFTKDKGAEFHPDRIDQDVWNGLMDRADYLQGDFSDAATFEAVAKRVGDRSAVFYLAVSSRFFGPVGEALGQAGLFQEPDGGFRRLIVEKPFGSDLASAKALNKRLLAVASEDQVYRIDHFMGKEPVQSILALRFANRLFAPLFDGRDVDRIEITAAETLGVEGRGAFYEPTGVVRDMVPNHMFQLLAMTAIDPPPSLDHSDLRDQSLALLQSIPALTPGDTVLGQYGAGTVNGNKITAYRESKGVAVDSRTPTYVALKLTPKTDRWGGTPIYLRTGKCLAARRTEIVVHFKAPEQDLFADRRDGATDRIVISIAPSHAVTFDILVKRPGPKETLAPATLEVSPEEIFGDKPNVGYETLLYDCLMGEKTLFQRADVIEEAWRIVDPILPEGAVEVHDYPAGSDGPKAAAALIPQGWEPLS